MKTTTTITKHGITAAAREAGIIGSAHAGQRLLAITAMNGCTKQPLRIRAIAWGLLASGIFCLSAGAEPAYSGPAERPEARAAFDAATADLPLAFEPDLTIGPASFVAHGTDYLLHLNGGQAVLTLTAAGHETSLQMSFPGADAKSALVGLDKMPMKSNYLVGDESQWHHGVANYAKVAYRNLYRGVDLVYYGHHGRLEYDFVVAPGADAKAIQMAFPGAQTVRVEEGTGDLLISTAEHVQIRHQRPQIYQESASVKVSVEGHYRLIDRNTVGLSVAAYDPTKSLIIDPTVSFDTFASGNNATQVSGISVDGAGNSYIAGFTLATNSTFPGGAPDSSELIPKKSCPHNGSLCEIAFLMKLAPNGAIVYTTFFGGKYSDQPLAITNDSTWAYVVGGTNSPTFISGNGSSLKGGAMQVNGQSYAKGVAGNDLANAFLAVFDLGTGLPQRYVLWGGTGNNIAQTVAVDSARNAYVAGRTCANDFPTSVLVGRAPYQKHLHGTCAAFVTKIDPNDSIKNGYSTYLSGSSYDNANAIIVDSDGSTWIAGHTTSQNFPSTNLSHAGSRLSDAFVTHLSADGSEIISSTIFGASELYSDTLNVSSAKGSAVVADGAGGVYLAGTAYLDSTDSLYTSANALQTFVPCLGWRLACNTGFVSHIDLNGNVIASTYLAGSSNAAGNVYDETVYTETYSIARSPIGDIYVGGATSTSIGFPGAPAINPTSMAGFVTKLTPALDGVVSTTFAGNVVSGVVVTQSRLASFFSPSMTIYATGEAKEDERGEEGVFATKLSDPTPTVAR